MSGPYQWDGAPNAIDRLRAGLLGYLKERPEVAKGLLGGVYQLATDPASRESAMARAPKPFQEGDGQSMYDQAMAVGPQGLLGMVGKGGAAIPNMEAVATAKGHFGKTYNPKEAGYLAPTGEMLDLSGRHYGVPVKPGERDWYRGERQVDHRELGDALYAKYLPNGGSGTDAMRMFMNDANMVRMQPGVGFETTFVPTKGQLSTLERIWGYAKEPVAIDVAHPVTGDTISSIEMKNPTAKKIEDYIKKVLKDYEPKD